MKKKKAVPGERKHKEVCGLFYPSKVFDRQGVGWTHREQWKT